MADNLNEEVTKWYKSTYSWAQDLYNALLSGEDDIVALEKRAIGIATDAIKATPPTTLPKTLLPGNNQQTKVKLRLKKIQSIHNLGAIEENEGMEFATNETVIYGPNGSGKSTYVNLLKGFLGSTNTRLVQSNIFKQQDEGPTATLTYEIDGEEHQVDWNNESLPVVPHINIFDSSLVKAYPDANSDFQYQPRLLQIFETLARVADDMRAQLGEEATKLLNDRPKPDEEIRGTQIFSKITMRSNSYDKLRTFSNGISWDEKNEIELLSLKKSLNEGDIDSRISQKESQFSAISSFVDKITSLNKSYSNDKIKVIQDDLTNIQSYESALKKLAETSFSEQPVPAVGGDSWQLLWESARKFSEQAYGAGNFPYSKKDKYCLFCQQPLDENAENRLNSFEDFVSTNIQRELADAKAKFVTDTNLIETNDPNKLVEEFSRLMPFLPFRGRPLDAEMIAPLLTLRQEVVGRKTINLVDISALQQFEKNLRASGNQFYVDKQALEAAKKDFDSSQKRYLELKAVKWLNEHPEYLENTVDSLKIHNQISKNTNTQGFTIVEKKLADKLLTSQYADLFNGYLKTLGAEELKVVILPKSKKAKPQFTLVLDSPVTNEKISNILSDGQQAIVGLAAFLAEVSLSNWDYPIILDDPVSSLDQDFESEVASALDQLANNHQVIIFTHRIPFAFELRQLEAKKDDHSTNAQYALRHDPVGFPSASAFPYQTQSMKKSINSKIAILKQVKKMEEAQNFEDADQKKGNLVKEIRTLVEYGVETTLLGGVVQRFDRAVKTQNLRYISIVTADDLDKFNQWMTDYSFQDHSQPGEANVPLPSVQKIEKDLNDMQIWLTDFLKRKKPLD